MLQLPVAVADVLARRRRRRPRRARPSSTESPEAKSVTSTPGVDEAVGEELHDRLDARRSGRRNGEPDGAEQRDAHGQRLAAGRGGRRELRRSPLGGACASERGHLVPSAVASSVSRPGWSSSVGEPVGRDCRGLRLGADAAEAGHHLTAARSPRRHRARDGLRRRGRLTGVVVGSHRVGPPVRRDPVFAAHSRSTGRCNPARTLIGQFMVSRLSPAGRPSMDDCGESLWASIQGDPVFMRRVNGWLTILWVGMIPGLAR